MKSVIIDFCAVILGIFIQIYSVQAFDYATYQGEYYESDGFEYALYEDNTAYISIYRGKLEPVSDFEIPSEIDGHTVSGFSQGMFASFLGAEIDTLYIPETISEIHLCGSGFITIDYIDVDDNNPYYIDDGGVVYSRDLSELVWCPNNICYYKWNVGDGCEKIDDYAFEGVSKLIELTLPESLKSVGAYAFYETSLPYIKIPASVERINTAGFPKEIDSVVVSEYNKYYYDIDGVLFDKESDSLIVYPSDRLFEKSYRVPDGTKRISRFAFEACERLEELIISDGVKKIDSHAVSNMKMLETIELQDGLEIMEPDSFTNLPSLNYIYIPQSVISMEDAFDGSLGLEHFDVDECNPNYKSVDGVLFDKKMKTLLEYPVKKSDITEYVVPEGVENLAESAIGYNEYLEKIIVSNGVKRIGAYGINFCENLEEVFLPPSLEEIGIVCEGMENVTFFVQQDSYAAQWCDENLLNYIYVDF